MASSKLLALTLGSSLLRSHRLASSSPLLPGLSTRLLGPHLPLRFCSSSAAAAEADAPDPAPAAATAAAAAAHPWPEWGDFLDKMRSKGYFERPAPPSGGADAAAEGAAAVEGEAAVAEDAVAAADPYLFREQNRVKNACLKFARERFDLLSALPKQDIKAIVESGCPNIYRKTVNSGKRLREFVQVDEDDACSICKLRGSCDKAFVIPKAEEGARTVDVVRILLTYAIDPTSLSGENSVDKSVQESARSLLSKLIMLSDTTIDPSLPKPVLQTSSKQEPSAKVFSKGSQPAAKSRVSAGKGKETTSAEMKKGDWLCPNCNFLNFSRNRHCLECKADGPKKVEADTAEMKAGDWICPQCHFMNFSRNKMCFKCEESRPKRQLNPGEWECPKCDFVNFRRNTICLKCNHDRPEDDNQLGYNSLRNTKGPGKSRSFDSVGHEDDSTDAPPNGGERKGRRATPDAGKSTRRSMNFSFTDKDDKDDVLPYEGERKHVAHKRATPSQRKFTAARSR